MARDGAGTHNLAEAAFVNGTTIDADAMNSDLSDISSALTGSLAKDGQTVPTANLPMGAFKHTGVADGSARTDYAALGQVAKGTLFYAADTGAADAYVIAPSPGIAANVAGFTAHWKVTNANLTTTPNLATNSLTAGTIVWPDGSALAVGDLPANAHVSTRIASLSGATPTWHLLTVTIPPVGRVGNQTVAGNKTFSGNTTITAGANSFLGSLGASTATTQSYDDSSTKVATTAQVAAALAAAPRIVAMCKATGTTRDKQFNVASVTKNSAGNFTFAFTSNIDANAVIVASAYSNAGSSGDCVITAQSASAVTIVTYDGAGTPTDYTAIHMTAHA